MSKVTSDEFDHHEAQRYDDRCTQHERHPSAEHCRIHMSVIVRMAVRMGMRMRVRMARMRRVAVQVHDSLILPEFRLVVLPWCPQQAGHVSRVGRVRSAVALTAMC